MPCPPESQLVEIALLLHAAGVRHDRAFEGGGESALAGCASDTVAAHGHARTCPACRERLFFELMAEALHREMASRGSRMVEGQPEPLLTYHLRRTQEADEPVPSLLPFSDPAVRGAAPTPPAISDPAGAFVNADGSLLARLIPRKSGGVLAAVLGLNPPPPGQVFAIRTLGQEFRLDDDFTAVVPIVPADDLFLTVRPANFFSGSSGDPD